MKRHADDARAFILQTQHESFNDHDTPMWANGAETGLDAFAITPALERVAPELLTLVADQVSSTACRDPSRCGLGA